MDDLYQSFFYLLSLPFEIFPVQQLRYRHVTQYAILWQKNDINSLIRLTATTGYGKKLSLMKTAQLPFVKWLLKKTSIYIK